MKRQIFLLEKAITPGIWINQIKPVQMAHSVPCRNDTNICTKNDVLQAKDNNFNMRTGANRVTNGQYWILSEKKSLHQANCQNKPQNTSGKVFGIFCSYFRQVINSILLIIFTF